MTQIRLESVSRIYGRAFALHRVSLRLESGSLTAVVGDNGAGKSSLLNILATLDKPSDGEVFFGEHNWATYAKKGRHKIGWVSHDSLIYAELSGRENLEFFATMYGLNDPAKLSEDWLKKRSEERRVGKVGGG